MPLIGGKPENRRRRNIISSLQHATTGTLLPKEINLAQEIAWHIHYLMTIFDFKQFEVKLNKQEIMFCVVSIHRCDLELKVIKLYILFIYNSPG